MCNNQTQSAVPLGNTVVLATSIRYFRKEYDLIRVFVCTQANAAAFEACCKERIRQFDDAEEEEDIWEEKEMNYATQAKSRTR